MSETLRITEIFHSLQGEARSIGRPTVFVRLTGCPLRCGYCDSAYAFEGGTRCAVDDIITQVEGFAASYVCVTGGEPLAQPGCLALLRHLCDAGYETSLETSGAIDIAGVDERVSVVMDLKTPDSGEVDKNLYQNLKLLKRKDQLKFVICSEKDYQWARFKLDEYQLDECVSDVLFSPSYGDLPAVQLAEWILRDALPVRFQLQLHKQLWGEKAGV